MLGALQRARPRVDLLDRLLYTDLKTYLVELLMKQDQMSMSASIESRVPFLDHHLVEFAATLPADRKLAGFQTKRILREAVADVVPASVRSRSKMGFPVPFGQWMRTGWNDVARDVLLDRRARERDLVRPEAIHALLDDARVGAPGASDAVWSLLNLELWHRTFIDGDGIQTLPQPHVPRLASRVKAEESPPSKDRGREMRLLWLNANLLLPLDKGGRLRTWHLMRHLATRHDITYLCFARPRT